ncbi:MAG: hypothetical protein JJU45_17450 [Acidimicrobiia bacterium]|nr:hypothetical protein [Acidimicrobiia bacterium]
MGQRIVIVDAELVASWRRPGPSLAQLHEAVAALRRQEPATPVAVIADAALKWDLDAAERELVEDDIVNRFLLFAPAGCDGGLVGFLTEVVATARDRGLEPVIITARAVPDVALGRVRRTPEGWEFDLDAPQPTVVATNQGRHRKRRRTNAA